MNQPCARCSKIVYPTEKINCLDKIWHKGCFSCTTCKLKLTMKNYKGYNKLPYCNTHYPTTKFTAVADTPENLRLKKNSENQSDIKYHNVEGERKRSQGLVDTPESLRLKKNPGNQSDINYHKDEKVSVYAGGERKRSQGYNQPTYPTSPSASAQQPPKSYDAPPPQPPQSYEAPPPQPPQSYDDLPPQPVPSAAVNEPRYRALYDYTATDDDEVSFNDGDILVNVTIIDDGWMEGTVKRTGAHGLLPSNYVETI